MLPDYSLSTWAAERGLALVGDKLQDYAVEMLFEQLGIAPYLLESPCVHGQDHFANTVNGWNSGMPHVYENKLICHNHILLSQVNVTFH